MNLFSEILSSAATLPQILVVDDETPVRELVKDFLSRNGFHVIGVATGTEALEAARQLHFDAIVLDMVLGDADGLDLLQVFVASNPERPVIIMSGYGFDEQLAEHAQRHGATAFVSKTDPLTRLKVAIDNSLAAIRRANPAPAPKSASGAPKSKLSGTIPPAILERIRRPVETSPGDAATSGEAIGPSGGVAAASQRETQAARGSPLSAESPPPSARPEAPVTAPPTSPPPILLDPGEAAKLATVTSEGERFALGLEVFLRMLNAFDPNLGNTSMRAVVLCRELGESLNLPADQRQNLIWAAALHDIGLVRIERSLLNRWRRQPENCSKAELAAIRKHPIASTEMLASYPPLAGSAEIILAHHEQWDGGGFPEGLKMEAIPWLARLLSPILFYCNCHQLNERAVIELDTKRDALFDPAAVDAVKHALRTAPPTRGKRQMRVSQLRAGMVLAEDVIDVDGVTLLGRETALDFQHLVRLGRLAEVAHIESELLIYA